MSASHRRPVRKSERLEARISPELKRRVERAAALEGRSLTDFVTASIQQAAERTIWAYEVTIASVEYGRAFAETVANPPRPSKRAREAAAFFDSIMGDR